jgi:hypothetical protein
MYHQTYCDMYCSTFWVGLVAPTGIRESLTQKSMDQNTSARREGIGWRTLQRGRSQSCDNPVSICPVNVVIVVPVEGSKASSYESGGRPLNRHDAAGFRQHDDDVVAGR